MANDRIGLHCKACHDVLWLTKYYPGCGEIDIGKTLWLRAFPWVNHHLEHDPAFQEDRPTLDDTPIVEFITESLDRRTFVRDARWYTFSDEEYAMRAD